MQPACASIGIHARTYRRWKCNPLDKRKGSKTHQYRALSEEEWHNILAVCTSTEFKDCTPAEIVARLEEQGIYLGSVRTFYRVLNAAGLVHHRGNTRPPRRKSCPPELKATGPDQVYTWDITWLPSSTRGIFYYCYAIVDVWSREIVGWSIHEEESEVHGRALFERLARTRNLSGVWVHSDNGNPMRGTTFSVWLTSLGMFLSHSRPLVKNDNPYIESFFKTMKYHAAYPGRFHSLEEARQWMGDFIHWYNTVHRHSGIGFVTPAQRMQGEDLTLFALRNATLMNAWKRLPHRFPKSGPKLWTSTRVVYLNPSQETRRFIHEKVS